MTSIINPEIDNCLVDAIGTQRWGAIVILYLKYLAVLMILLFVIAFSLLCFTFNDAHLEEDFVASNVPMEQLNSFGMSRSACVNEHIA